jgi:hypothetical protein
VGTHLACLLDEQVGTAAGNQQPGLEQGGVLGNDIERLTPDRPRAAQHCDISSGLSHTFSLLQTAKILHFSFMTSDGKHIFRVNGHCFRFFTFSALSTYTRPFTPTFHTYARKKRKNGKMKKPIFFSTVVPSLPVEYN